VPAPIAKKSFRCPNGYKKDANRFYRDTEDCEMYYVCEDNSVNHMSCAVSQRFDPVSRYCVSSDKVSCQTILPTGSDFMCPAGFENDANRFYQDIYNCNMFYMCADDSVNHWSCSGDQRFDPKTRLCVAAEAVPCTQVMIPSNKFTCPSNFAKDTNRFYQDPQDCNMFYVCTDDVVKRWSCGGDQRFDPKTRYCVPRKEVPCVQIVPAGGKFMCPFGFENDTNANYEDVADCSKFYACVGDKVGLNWACQKGERFDPKARFCAPANEVPCNQVVVNNSPAAGVVPTTKPDHVVKFTCPSGFEKDANHFYQDPKNCNRFYVCQKDNQVENWSCQKGERFNPKTRFCVPADEVPCKQSVGCDTTKFTCPIGFEKDANRFYQDPENCNRFYVCQKDNQVDNWSCQKGERFNPKTRFCAPADEVPCEQSVGCDTTKPAHAVKFTCPIGFEKETNRFYRDPADCHMFYVCGNDSLKHFFCAGVQRFDPKTRLCVDADKVNCINGKLPNSKAFPIVKTIRPTTAKVVPTTTPALLANGFTCPADWAAQPWSTFPYPGDCYKYCACFGVGLDFDIMLCPTGTYFDTTQYMCMPGVPNRKC